MSSSSSSISLVSETSSKTHSTMSIESSLNDSSNEQSKMSVSTPELEKNKNKKYLILIF